MPLPARRRRKKGPDEEERAAGFSAEVMAPTRMKLRRRDTASASAPAGGALEGDADKTRECRRSSRRKNVGKASAPVAPDAPASSPPSTSSGAARPAVAAEASPDSKCPICLDRFNNLAYLDHCLHRFCFPCIQEWSHNKAECPLCKQPFASILHSVRAEDDFKEYTLQPPPRAANQLTASTFLTTVAAMTADGAQHHLRLMLRRHLVAADRDAVRRRRRRERAASGRRSTDRVGEWEFFMHSPPLPVSPYHLDMSELIMDNMRVEEVAEEMMRRDEERRQALSEELAGLRGAAAPSARASRRLMCRLAVRQQLQREGATVQMREREVAAFRKALYQSGIRVRGVSGNQGRPRSVAPETFRRGTGHLNRLNGWLRRELAVLLGPHAPLSDVVLRTVTARVLRSGLEDAAALEEDLRPFLLARTEHFVHELVSFGRSSLSMESYDQLAVYEPPAAAAAMELEPLSSPSDDSSVIAISEEEEERGGRAEAVTGSHDDVIQTGSSLSLSGWDDETPGPSYTSAEPPHSLTTPPLSPAPQQPTNQEGAEPRGEEEECLIVGYKKPIAERTPELVQLSSDSEEVEGEKKKEEEEVEVGSATVDKTPPPPAPYLPIIPPSTSGAFRAEQQKEANSRRRSASWSESSGQSRKSVCSLSPATPATPERRRRDRKQQGERRRKKKKQRGRDRSREPHGKSGTFCNPNRSILPPMMSRCSPSPFDSSPDSASSPQSPPDSGWELRFSQVSPLTSSASSPSRSFSPLCSSPGTPPSPPCSPKRPHHVEKPGGKRKYKSRHLNSSKEQTRRPSRGRQRDREHRKRLCREAERRDNSLKTGSRRSRDDRSPSVEIVYEGTIDSGAAQPSTHKRRRRRHRRAQVTSSPVIITLDSDSSHDDGQKKTNSGSSSPLSSQQTIDFSDLPSLPLAPSAGVGGAVEVGELPADILDRGSDGSESEAAVRSGAVRRGDRSDHSYVDVENTEDAVSLLETTDDQQEADAKKSGHREDPSDRYLLEAILDDLNRIAPPRQNPSQDGSFLSENRERKLQEVIRLEGRTGSGPTSPTGCQQNPDSVPPPLERMEGREVPPLLRRASPVGSYRRNTPPPLKHKDAGSPPHGAAGPPNVGPRCSDPNPTGRTSPGLSPLVIPLIATIQNQLSGSPSASGAALPSAAPRVPAWSGSDRLPSLRFGSFPSMELFHSSESLKLNLPLTPATSSHSPDLHPAHRRNPVSPTPWVGVGGLGPSGWDFFSGLNFHGAAAFRPERPPPGGVRPDVTAAARGQEVGVPPLSDSASNHKALAPPPSQHALGFSQSEHSSQSESRSEPIHLSESDSKNRNNPSSAAAPGSPDQNQQQSPNATPLSTHPHDPTHHPHDSTHHRHDSTHHPHDPTHHPHDPTHHPHDSTHHPHDSSHHPHDPTRLSESPHNISFDSAHLPYDSAPNSSHRTSEPPSDNRPSDRLSGEIPP